MKPYLLSKSSFIRGMQCPKSLWMYNHTPELRDSISPSQQAIFDRGHEVGKLAQTLFPGGIDLSEKYGFQYNKSIPECKKLLDDDDAIIYEAPFLHSKVINLLDIMVKKNGKLYAYEVKSSTHVSDTYILDSAIQYWVMTNAGYEIEDFSIVYINNKYVRKGELELDKLFSVESILDLILPIQDEISEKVKEFKALVKSGSEPNVKIGAQCFKPYTCDFLEHCWKHVPEHSVMDIAGLHNSKKMDLIERDIFKFEDIPPGFQLNDKQQQQIDCELEQKSIIDKSAIKEFLDDLEYPLYFMDFETMNPVVPFFDNSRPYQQIPFQYSVHYLKSKGDEVKHFEFLAEAKEEVDSRIPFIENLIKVVKNSGDILVYNIAFERTRLKEIAAQFPEYADDIEKINLRLKDLMIPFQNRYYYTPEMRGSYSIKKVLPALVPNLSYSGLDIAEGGQASNAFTDLYTQTDRQKIKQVRKNLLEYCKMDTLAMVEILKVLENMAES